jgi:hypothetical protein
VVVVVVVVVAVVEIVRGRGGERSFSMSLTRARGLPADSHGVSGNM